MTYAEFIEYNKHTAQGEYTHKHHIIPVSIGGKTTEDNLIRLSWLTHYYAHYLLAKENPNNAELVKAYRKMGDVDSFLRKCYVLYTRVLEPLTDEQRKNLSNAMVGNTNSKRPHKYSKRKFEPPKSEEWKRKHSEAMKRKWAEKKGITPTES